MTTLMVELPESLAAALRCAPEELSSEMRFAAAANWYEAGLLSQEMAAQVAGLSRTDFLLALARHGKSSFRVDFVDLDIELERE